MQSFRSFSKRLILSLALLTTFGVVVPQRAHAAADWCTYVKIGGSAGAAVRIGVEAAACPPLAVVDGVLLIGDLTGVNNEVKKCCRKAAAAPAPGGNSPNCSDPGCKGACQLFCVGKK